MSYDIFNNTNWPKLVRWCLPTPLRKPKMLALMQALVSSVNDLHTRFTYYRANALYRLSITPQVCSLERALNDRYDVVQRRIYITDPADMNPLPLFRKSEVKPVRLFRKSEGTEQVLFTKSETSIFTTDFIINIPVTVSFDLAELTAFVNNEKLGGKQFKVKTV